jgi:hypothetical protein
MANLAEKQLIKAVDYNIAWHRVGNIEIITSEGDMRRVAVDLWTTLLHEVIASKPTGAALFILLDLTGPKQAATPYSMQTTRQVAEYVTNQREGNTYAAVLMKNALLVGIIRAFFHQYFARQEKLIYRLFTDETEAMAWLEEQVSTATSTGN